MLLIKVSFALATRVLELAFSAPKNNLAPEFPAASALLAIAEAYPLCIACISADILYLSVGLINQPAPGSKKDIAILPISSPVPNPLEPSENPPVLSIILTAAPAAIA